jgi:hypothetical protein
MDYRCSGPNCGAQKGLSNQWWLMWTSYGDGNVPLLSLCPWDDDLANAGGYLFVCGENCAQKLQSQFMGNILRNVRQEKAS